MSMQPSDRSGFFPSGQEPVDGQAARLEALGSQVAQAQAELEEYQRLLNELPGIYEGKFRQKLRSVAQEIRQLLDERKALQQQVGQALAETRQPKLLSASGAASEFPDHPKTQIWTKLQIPRFRRPPKLRLIGICTGTALVLVGAALVIPSLFSDRSPAPNGSTSIQLQARGGESWVLVEDLKGRQVFDGILQPGAPKRFLLAQGLRLRSGRADLLFIAMGDAVPKPLGEVGDLDWVEIRP